MIAGALASAASTVWLSTPGAPLLRTTFSSALARLASLAASSSSRLVSAAPALGPLVFLLLAFCSRKLRRSDASERSSPFRPPKGCRRTRGSIAVVPSFSIHLLLCSAGFHQPPRSYEEIRLLRGYRPVVVASFGSTARAGQRRPPWVSSLDCLLYTSDAADE